MKKILVVNVNWLGDCIMTLPVFKGLKDRYPDAFIAVMCRESVAAIFENNPYINQIIYFNERKAQRSLYSKIKFIRYLRKQKFDIAFFLHRSFTRVLICFLAGVKQRIGYRRRKSCWLLTRAISPPTEIMHKGDYYCNLLQSAGVRINNNQPQFNLTAEELKEVRNLPEYQDARKKFSHIIVLNPAANWQLKQWPVSYFIDFARMMLEANCAVFLVGSVAYRELITKIKEAVPQSYDLSGRTTLRQLAAVLASSDLVVSADSGPAHLAGALEVPTIVIFGPTLPQLSAPRSQAVVVIKDRVDCQLPCYNLKCQDNTCMKKIRPELVVERAKEILLKND